MLSRRRMMEVALRSPPRVTDFTAASPRPPHDDFHRRGHAVNEKGHDRLAVAENSAQQQDACVAEDGSELVGKNEPAAGGCFEPPVLPLWTADVGWIEESASGKESYVPSCSRESMRVSGNGVDYVPGESAERFGGEGGSHATQCAGQCEETVVACRGRTEDLSVQEPHSAETSRLDETGGIAQGLYTVDSHSSMHGNTSAPEVGEGSCSGYLPPTNGDECPNSLRLVIEHDRQREPNADSPSCASSRGSRADSPHSAMSWLEGRTSSESYLSWGGPPPGAPAGGGQEPTRWKRELIRQNIEMLEMQLERAKLDRSKDETKIEEMRVALQRKERAMAALQDRMQRQDQRLSEKLAYQVEAETLRKRLAESEEKHQAATGQVDLLRSQTEALAAQVSELRGSWITAVQEKRVAEMAANRQCKRLEAAAAERERERDKLHGSAAISARLEKELVVLGRMLSQRIEGRGKGEGEGEREGGTGKRGWGGELEPARSESVEAGGGDVMRSQEARVVLESNISILAPSPLPPSPPSSSSSCALEIPDDMVHELKRVLLPILRGAAQGEESVGAGRGHRGEHGIAVLARAWCGWELAVGMSKACHEAMFTLRRQRGTRRCRAAVRGWRIVVRRRVEVEVRTEVVGERRVVWLLRAAWRTLQVEAARAAGRRRLCMQWRVGCVCRLGAMLQALVRRRVRTVLLGWYRCLYSSGGGGGVAEREGGEVAVSRAAVRRKGQVVRVGEGGRQRDGERDSDSSWERRCADLGIGCGGEGEEEAGEEEGGGRGSGGDESSPEEVVLDISSVSPASSTRGGLVTTALVRAASVCNQTGDPDAVCAAGHQRWQRVVYGMGSGFWVWLGVMTLSATVRSFVSAPAWREPLSPPVPAALSVAGNLDRLRMPHSPLVSPDSVARPDAGPPRAILRMLSSLLRLVFARRGEGWGWRRRVAGGRWGMLLWGIVAFVVRWLLAKGAVGQEASSMQRRIEAQQQAQAQTQTSLPVSEPPVFMHVPHDEDDGASMREQQTSAHPHAHAHVCEV